ncbi:hypothetical protein V5F32_10470 [Xanthobacter oligotrophicus]|uniref:Uncharacterized protein n=1 Tax=Xanthobacter oligotrophicus TaxID=2607286 RepID=A0ABW6ZXS7_9HYPH
MFIYRVMLRGDPEGEMHVRDKRPPKIMARDLVKDGYLVTEAVSVRAATSAFDDASGHTVKEEFFSATPIGAAVLVREAVAALVEHVVPKGAEPMPELPERGSVEIAKGTVTSTGPARHGMARDRP